MNLEGVDKKELSQIEQLAKELAVVLVRANLGDEALCKALQQLSKDAADTRQVRFDKADDGYKGF